MIATLILILHMFGVGSAHEIAVMLLISGALYIIADIFLVSMGILTLNGLMALYIGYALYYGPPTVLGVPMGWGLIFGVAFLELLALGISIYVFMRIKNKKATTGQEGLIGAKARVVEWDGQKGKVFIHGETWRAISLSPLDFSKDDEAEIMDVKELTLTVGPPDLTVKL